MIESPCFEMLEQVKVAGIDASSPSPTEHKKRFYAAPEHKVQIFRRLEDFIPHPLRHLLRHLMRFFLTIFHVFVMISVLLLQFSIRFHQFSL
ncbi:MAG: hypothetical protein IJ604_07380 [Prevotella sp.]|nr:hypothetical protein [Prevotella sp.]